MKFIILISFLFLACCTPPKETIKRVNVFKNPNIPPKDCQIWFDGCNKCSVQNQHILACSKMSCFEFKPKKCLKYIKGPSKEEIAKKTCKKNNGIWQRKTNGQWICMYNTNDHNNNCQSSKECEGLCLYFANKPSGYCSRYKPFVGCAHEYLRGKHFEVCE